MHLFAERPCGAPKGWWSGDDPAHRKHVTRPLEPAKAKKGADMSCIYLICIECNVEDCACRGSLFLGSPWMPAHGKYLAWIGISTILLRCKALIEISYFSVHFEFILVMHQNSTQVSPAFIRKIACWYRNRWYFQRRSITVEFVTMVSVG